MQARQKKYEPAINTLKELSTTAKDELPLDGVLMQLGRTYALAGRKAEAVQTYQRLTTEFPSSAYAGDAKKEIDALKAGRLDAGCRSQKPARSARTPRGCRGTCPESIAAPADANHPGDGQHEYPAVSRRPPRRPTKASRRRPT